MPLAGAFSRLLRGVLLLVGLLVTAYGAATGWNLWSDYRLTLAAAENDARNLATALEAHAANVFGETARTVLSLSETLPRRRGELDRAPAAEMLRARIKRTPYLFALAVYDGDGKILVHSSVLPAAREAAVSEREDFVFHRESPLPRIFILPPAPQARPQLIRVSTRLGDPDGAFRGIVEAQVDPEFFNLFYTSINVGTGGRIHLIRQDGATLIEVPETGHAASAIANQAELRDRLVKTVAGTVVDDSTGIVAYRRLAKLPLVALVSLARDEAMAPWRDRALKQAGAAAAVSALVIVLGWLLWLQINRLDAQDKALQQLVEKRTAELAQRNTELEQAYRSLEEASITDQLTGLKNRRYLLQHLEADVALSLRRYKDWLEGSGSTAGADLVFFLVDLDHFKAVNDDHGHATGDLALIEMSRRLERVFRDSDHVVRWGGEEFLAVARGADRSDAPAIAEKIREAIGAQPFHLGTDLVVPLTCSIGVACYPFRPGDPSAVTWVQVVDQADQALYRAKREGRNTVRLAADASAALAS